MIIALALGAAIGLVFASKDNAYLVWVDLLGDLYIQLITLLVAPVILLSILSGFIRLGSGKRMKRIGAQSVFWLLLQSALAVLLSLIVGLGLNLGSTASSVFAQIDALEESTLSAYAGTTRPLTEVLRGLFPSNVLGDIVNNNVPGIILIALVLSIACLAVERQEGAEAVAPFCRGVEALRRIVFAVTDFFMELTPYAVLALTAWFLSVGSAGVPGIAVVSAIALFSTVGLPIGAVVLLVPINTISDMMRTLTNVSSAAIAAAIVARRTGELDDAIFDGKHAGAKEKAS